MKPIKTIFLIVASMSFVVAALIFVPMMLHPSASSTVYWVAAFVFSLLIGLFSFVWRLLTSVLAAIDSSSSLHHRGTRIRTSDAHEADPWIIESSDSSDANDDHPRYGGETESSYDTADSSSFSDSSSSYSSDSSSSSSSDSSSSSSDSSSSSSSDW